MPDLDLARELDSTFAGRRVLVTGHTGFKGGWLSLWLHRLGAEVHGYSLEPPTEPNLFAAARIAEVLQGHVTGDVRDGRQLARLFESVQPELVFHLAAQSLVRLSHAEPKETFDTNVGGTVNILECVRTCPATRVVVNVTSDKCYDNQEWVWGYRENDRLGGNDPYSASKAAAELVFAAYEASYFSQRPELGAASVRAGNVIGGGDWAADRIVPDAVRSLAEGRPIPVRNPHSTRPWQHVLEPLGGYLLLAARLQKEPQRFAGAWNFGPSLADARSVRHLVEEILTAWGSGEWRDESGAQTDAPPEAGHLSLCCDKARTALAWSPRWSFERAVAATVGWYKAYHRGEDMLRRSQQQIDDYLSGDGSVAAAASSAGRR